MTAMPRDEPISIQTRPSLLNRLKTGDDASSWQEFYRIYGKLVRDFAISAGLTDSEADEVVQETTIGLARHLPRYRYDPKVCRFKTWLLRQASWRVKDQFRKRKNPGCVAAAAPADPSLTGEDTTRTTAVHRIPDTAAEDLDALFDAQWRRSLLDAALERMRTRFSPKQIQVFDLLVRKEWPAAQVARSLGITMANVYVTRHRISAAIKTEIKRLEAQIQSAAERSNPIPG